MFGNPWIMVPAVALMSIKVSQKLWRWYSGRRARRDFERKRALREQATDREPGA